MSEKETTRKVAPALARWAAEAPADEERTVVVRPSYSSEPEAVRCELEGAGARVESAGLGAVTAVVTPASLGRVADLPVVRAVEAPRRLFTRLPGG